MSEFVRGGAYTVLVHTATLADLRAGRVATHTSHVRVSADYTPHEAIEIAACMAAAVHRGTATTVHHVI